MWWEDIKQELLDEMDMSQELTDEELRELIRQKVSSYACDHLMGIEEYESSVRYIFNALRKMDVIQYFLDDDQVTEIMINGSRLFYEKNGQVQEWPEGPISAERLEHLIQRIVGESNRTINEAQPIVDTRLKDGSRVNIVLSNVSIDGPAISIRKFPEKPMDFQALIQMQTMSQEVADFLVYMVKAGYNIFVSGGTSSGKTTFLNAMSEHIPEDQRVITIEDSAELQMKSLKNLVRLEARPDNGSGSQEITIRALIKTALRMRPDRIIVGEVRGGEALDMLQSFNTGHDGSFSTGHANSTKDMLSRLETLVLFGMNLPLEAVRRQIASGIDILVHLSRMRDKSRKVVEISEILGVRNGKIQLNQLYEFQETGEEEGVILGQWVRTGQLKDRGKLQREGLEQEFRKGVEG